MAAMAVKDESLHHATDGLILQTPRKWYKGIITTSHWQLRQLISSPVLHNIYFPSDKDIIRLNTKTREREVITTLSFSPRCLTAAKGWICCGGDKGEYTAIPLEDEDDEQGREGSLLRDFNAGLAADPDARLPLDLDPPRRSTPLSRQTVIMRRLRGFNHSMSSNIKSIGTEIVNCITIWVPPSTKLSDDMYKTPVAVVANNDCSVCIMDLQDSEILERLSFPDFVNRAVMSPDGSLLIAICDDPFMYIHRRKPKSTKLKAGQFEAGKSTEYEWVLWGKVQLEGQRISDKSNMRGSFAACFSKSGAYLATASQYGVISVFDTRSLLEEDCDPLMALFTSSRPNSESTTGANAPGAVRAMEFSPEPFDLLAWTEASGRIGVADVRNLCYSRQSINIDAHAASVERVNIADRPIERLEPLIDPRLRSFRSEAPSTTSSTPDYLGMDYERRQLRLSSREMLDRHQSPLRLTPEEMQVLEASSSARRERDRERDERDVLRREETRDRTPGSTATRTVHSWGPASAWNDDAPAASTSSSLTAGERSSAAERSSSTAALPSALRDFISSDRSAASFRAFINERNQDRERRGATTQHPRRRGSVILAAAQTELERITRGSRETTYSFRVPGSQTHGERMAEARSATRSRSVTRSNNDDTGSEAASSLERLQIDPPPRLPAIGSESSSDPWADIEALYSSRFPTDPPMDVTTRLRVETENEDRRDFAHRLRQPWRPLDEFATVTRLAGRYESLRSSDYRSSRPGREVETMGCAWSEDGRILYVGAEDGIHEFHVNVHGRKFFPSLVLR